jgi:hypothetical protein
MRKLTIALIAVFLGSVFSVSAQSSASMAMPEVLVYKTRGNYRNLVPVQLSPDRKRIVSYSAPGDLKTGGGYALPVPLHDGYLLDRRGVGWHTAFLKYTYEEYGKLATIPDMEELYKMIVDKNPLTELYDCGRREPIPNLVHKLNDVIDEEKLMKRCIPVKKDLKPARY